MRRRLTLSVLPGTFAVCRLHADEHIPAWAAGAFVSVTRTADELSVVCADDGIPDGVRREGGWRCLKAHGPFDFALVGVLVSLLAPLAEAGVGVFAASTFDTDYVLVKDADLPRALEALSAAGHEIVTR